MTYADFQIVSHPDFLSMTPGAVVSYYAVLDGMKNDALLEDYSFRWQCINDPATARGAGTKIFAGPTTRHWKNAKWDFTGLHRIVLHVTFPNGEKRSYERRQWIDSAHNILGREFDPRANDTLPGPYQALAHQEVYLQTLQDMAASHAPPADKKEAHDELVARTTAYIGHLKFLLKGLEGKEAYAVDALHLDTERSTRSSLLLWLVNVSSAPDERTWYLIDWTNPSHASTSGRYNADADTDADAIAQLLEEWDSGNSYPPGSIKYRFDVPERGILVESEFETDGKTFWDSVSSWLDYIALGAVAVAGVVTLVAPIPGSRVVSAAIWTSIFTSTAAATVNIAQRHAAGHGNWKDDAFDGLSIVGNIFAGAGMAWKVGATLTSASRLGPKMSKAVLIGQISTDGVQGILLGHEYLGQYQKIVDDPTLAPSERIDKMLELFRSAALAGVLTYISIKGTHKDLENFNSNQTNIHKSQLADASAEIDLDAAQSGIAVKPDDTKVKSDIETEPNADQLGTQTKREIKDQALDEVEEDFTERLRAMVKSDAEYAKLKHSAPQNDKRDVAVSRAGYRDADLIGEKFVNIPITEYRFRPNKGSPPGTRLHNSGEFYEIVHKKLDTDDLVTQRQQGKELVIAQVKKEYSNLLNPLHPYMEQLLSEYIDRVNLDGGMFHAGRSLPGFHAEVQATNALFHQMKVDPSTIDLSKIEVATFRLQTGKNQWGEFVACQHCGGILRPPITVITGR